MSLWNVLLIKPYPITCWVTTKVLFYSISQRRNKSNTWISRYNLQCNLSIRIAKHRLIGISRKLMEGKLKILYNRTINCHNIDSGGHSIGNSIADSRNRNSNPIRCQQLNWHYWSWQIVSCKSRNHPPSLSNTRSLTPSIEQSTREYSSTHQINISSKWHKYKIIHAFYFCDTKPNIDHQRFRGSKYHPPANVVCGFIKCQTFAVTIVVDL